MKLSSGVETAVRKYTVFSSSQSERINRCEFGDFEKVYSIWNDCVLQCEMIRGACVFVCVCILVLTTYGG